MTLVVDILARVARQVSISAPLSWLTATADEYLEIRDDFMIETVYDVLDRVDLPSPIGVTWDLTADGSESYALPTDFRRMQRDDFAVYESTTSRRVLSPISSDGLWTHIQQIGSTGAERFYRIQGYDENFTISVFQEPSASVEITLHYISRNWLDDGAGTKKWQFTADTDVCLLPRKLVELGTVKRWRDRKGLDTTSVERALEVELSRNANDSKSRRVINFGAPLERQRPWDVPAPDVIPSS